MKKVLPFLLCLACAISVYGQVAPSQYKMIREREALSNLPAPTAPDSSLEKSLTPLYNMNRKPAEVKTDMGLISAPAFSKLIKRDISFIILGSQSPTPGFSLDLSNELSVKITGQVPQKKGLLTIDFGASRINNDIPVFEEGKFNGKLNLGINYHYIPKGVLRVSKKLGMTFGSYAYTGASKELVDELTYRENTRLRNTLLDSVAVLTAYVSQVFPEGFRALYADSKSKKAIDMVFGNTLQISQPTLINVASYGTRRSVYLSAAAAYVTLPQAFTTIGALNNYLTSAQHVKIEKLLTDLQRLAQSYNKLADIQTDGEIARAEPYWLRKQLQWFTFSAKPVLYTLNTYENDTTKKVIRTGSMNFVEVEIPIWYQLYDIGVKGGNLLRFGVNFIFGSNREQYRAVKYTTNDALATYPPYNLAEQKQEAGIYVNNMTRDYQLYPNYYIEYYRLPKKNFIPGYSVKFAYQKKSAFGDDTDRKTRVEAGLVFNILNKEKDQSAFTLQPYAGLTSLGKETIIDNGETRNKRLAEKLVVGIRLGLPIRNQLALGK